MLVALVWARSADAGAPVCGDVNASGAVTASDALFVLRSAVGQPVDLVCPATGQPLKTGQQTCYEPSGLVSGTIDCNGTGQDGELQAGIARFFSDNGNGTVTDESTGLMWEKLSDDGSIHDKDNTYTWSQAFATKIAGLNDAGFAGYHDWRVPNRFELETLVHLDSTPVATWPAFEHDCAPDCTAATCNCPCGPNFLCWSSSTYVVATSNAWVVLFSDGRSYPDVKVLGYGVRAVRSAGATP